MNSIDGNNYHSEENRNNQHGKKFFKIEIGTS